MFVVSGCASGIGARIVSLLAERGGRVLASDIDLPGLQAQAERLAWPSSQVRLCSLDVRQADAWQAAVDDALKTWGQLDVVINNAGVLKPGYIHELPLEDLDLHIDTNVKGMILGTRAAARQMVQQGHGHIVNIASLAGIAAVPGLCLYTASKFAARGFSLSAAEELRPLGVALTVVCPDLVKSPMYDLQLDFPEADISFSGSRPLHIDEVATLVVGRVLKHRPLQVCLPPIRGWTARVVATFPDLSRQLIPWLRRKGAAEREARRLQREP